MILRKAILSGILFFTCFSVHGEIALSDSSAYLGIFVVDYTDSTFEKGTVQKLTPCSGCDSLPLKMEFQNPGDFGGVAFRYTGTNDTVFSGTIIWMGGGTITKPSTLSLPDSFTLVTTAVPLPVKIKYFYHSSLTSSPNIDYAWRKIEKLRIVNDLMEQICFVGLYLYPPSVGVFDPDAAKIIVFIFRNFIDNDQVVLGYSRNSQCIAPKRKILMLNYNANQGIGIRMDYTGYSAIFDLQGRMVKNSGHNLGY